MKTKNRLSDPKHAKTLVLQSFFPYQVRVFYTEVTSAVAKAYEHNDGISAAEWRCMVILNADTDVALTAVEIVTASSMDKVSVSRAMSRLRTRGWVTETANDKDGRSKLLTLSDTGQAVLQKLIPKVLEVERQLLTGISPEQLAQFYDTMARISENRTNLNVESDA